MKAKTMTPKPKFPCDSCGKPFEIKLKVEQVCDAKGEHERRTFNCPFCGRGYLAFDGKDEV